MHGGVFFRQKPDAGSLNSEQLLQSLNRHRTADVAGIFKTSHILLANCITKNTPQSSKSEAPYIHSESGCVIVAWARLDYRKVLFERLSLPLRELLTLADNELIIRAYLHWGNECTQYLFGDYSFAIYDPRNHRVFCGRDHMGVRPFYYYLSDDIFAFSTTQTFFHQLPNVPMHADESWVARYLIHASMDFEKTAYKNIVKLKPAHSMVVSKSRADMSQYFHFDAYATNYKPSSAEYIEAYQEKLISAVNSRTQSSYPVGSELSGGIDSSSVTAIAADRFSQPLSQLYTFGFAMLEKEPRCILPVSQKYGLANNFICCNAQPTYPKAILNRALHAVGSPVEHGNATFHSPFYELCQTFNVRTLLSGFGGDEFVTTLHANIACFELFREKKYRAVYNSLYGNSISRLLRLIKLPYQYHQHMKPYNMRYFNAYKSRWAYNILKNEIVDRYDLEKIYFDQTKFDHGYAHLNKFTLEKRWVPFVSTRMENCSLLANSYGIDYSWPLLDVQLIEYFLSIPVEEKQPRGIYRYIHRKASEPFVPKDIIWQKNKYMGERVSNKLIDPSAYHFESTLSPVLEFLIDVDKFQQQLEILKSGVALEQNQQMQLVRNFTSMMALNAWLLMLDGNKFSVAEALPQVSILGA